jgi:Protein of unknwon function (DUF3310)
MSALDRQVGGVHYRTLAIQPVAFIMANQMGFCEGNVVKYVTRWRQKGGLEDLRKVRHYLQFIQENEEYMAMLARTRRYCNAGAWWRDAVRADEYIEANSLAREEAGVIRHITDWSNTGAKHHLVSAVKWADDLLARATS